MSTFTTELLVQEEDIGKRLDIFLHKNLKPYFDKIDINI